MIWLLATALASEVACRTLVAEGAYAAAADACATCEPGGQRTVRACDERLAWLEARRDPDGGLGGAEALERLRRGAGDLDAVAALAASPAVAHVVRADAAVWLARRAPGPREALDALTPWLPGRASLPEEVRRPMITLAAEALAELGRAGEGQALLAEVRPVDVGVSTVDRVVRARRERYAAALGGAGLAAFLLATSRAALRGPALGPGVAILAGSATAAWALAEAFERGAGAPILAVGAALVPLHAWCAAAAGPAPGPAFRVAAASATFAAAYEVLWASGHLPW